MYSLDELQEAAAGRDLVLLEQTLADARGMEVRPIPAGPRDVSS